MTQPESKSKSASSPPVIPTEIYGMIAKQMNTPEYKNGYLKTSTSLANQAQLANFMKVSKATYEETRSILYEDLAINDYEAFRTTVIESPESLKFVRRIRLCQDGSIDFKDLEWPKRPTPRQMILEGLSGHSNHLFWTEFGNNALANQAARAALLREEHSVKRLAKTLYQSDARNTAVPVFHSDTQGTEGNDSSQAQPVSALYNLLPRLEKVVIDPESTVERSKIAFRGWRYFYPEQSYIDSLPLFLINHPSVEHYCQAPVLFTMGLVQQGLGQHVFKLSNPPKVVTLHIHHDIEECEKQGWTRLGWGFQFSFILGTVNRYMFEKPWILVSTDDTEPRDDDSMISRRLDYLCDFLKAHFVIHKDDKTDRARVRTTRRISSENATLEIYNFVNAGLPTRSFRSASPQFNSGSNSQTAHTHARELRRIQQMLDDKIAGNRHTWGWMGKVILKTDLEAPPRSACGMVIVEQAQCRQLNDRIRLDAYEGHITPLPLIPAQRASLGSNLTQYKKRIRLGIRRGWELVRSLGRKR